MISFVQIPKTGLVFLEKNPLIARFLKKKENDGIITLQEYVLFLHLVAGVINGEVYKVAEKVYATILRKMEDDEEEFIQTSLKVIIENQNKGQNHDLCLKIVNASKLLEAKATRHAFAVWIFLAFTVYCSMTGQKP